MFSPPNNNKLGENTKIQTAGMGVAQNISSIWVTREEHDRMIVDGECTKQQGSFPNQNQLLSFHSKAGNGFLRTVQVGSSYEKAEEHATS